MRQKKLLLVIPAVAVLFMLDACSCNCGKNSTEEKIIKGYITLLGNEPFTRLAVRTQDDKYFYLQCSKELEKELRKKQGDFYYFQYNSTVQEDNKAVVIIVEKALPVIKEN